MKIKIITVIASIILLGGVSGNIQAQKGERSPEQVVQALVDAFNNHDIEAILTTYSPDSIARTLPDGEIILRGHEDIRKKFTKSFKSDPKVKVEIVKRIIAGKFVIDEEKIIGGADGKKYKYGAVIYEVVGGLIRNEWYFRQ